MHCKLGAIIKANGMSHDYRYSIGAVVNDMKILKQIRMIQNSGNKKGYVYQCLKDGYIGKISEGNLNKRYNCPVCANRKVMIGINDIWTTNPELANLLADPKDGYKHTEYSDQRVDWKCPRCGTIIKNKKICNTNRYELSCPACSDGISYPEKFMYNLLEQLMIKFKYQVSHLFFRWCKGKNYDVRYDFYIPLIDCIIETHGLQHYKNIGGKWGTIEEIQTNDKFKRQLAKDNGFTDDHYVVIDCRCSDPGWIEENILHGQLAKLLDFSKIDWNRVDKESQKSIAFEVCQYRKTHPNSITSDISKFFELDIETVRRYLKTGNKFGLCYYENDRKKKVICITTQQIYSSVAEASRALGINHTNISACCKHKAKSAGTLNNTKLVWEYYNTRGGFDAFST